MKSFLHQLHLEYGLSHAQLAVLLQTTRSTISRYLLGIRPLPPAAETKLAELFTLYHQVPLQARPTEALPMASQGKKQAGHHLRAMQQAKQIETILQRRFNMLQHRAGQQMQLQQLLLRLACNSQLWPVPAQQRCIEGLCHQNNSRMEKYRLQLEELQAQLTEAKREYVWQQHCMMLEATDIPNSPGNLPNNG
ncbi:MAG TPA: helix-turn-helix transcriptional regulator [Phnomibacter sp.]|nr:helix-turn-helix transcriptional regulator [Phnomibacter sp.]